MFLFKCRLKCRCPFLVWCLGHEVEFDCNGSLSLPFLSTYSNSATASFQHNYSSIAAIDPLQGESERPPKSESNIVLYVVLSV